MIWCPHCKNEPHFSGPHPEGMLKKFHPLAGHGFTPETGWTHPEAKRLSDQEQRTANAIRVVRVHTPEAKA